jgi:hypothetical protein
VMTDVVNERRDAMTKTYAIEDGDGNNITTGLSPESHARQVAQRLASERGSSVWLYCLEEVREAIVGGAEPPASEEVAP